MNNLAISTRLHTLVHSWDGHGPDKDRAFGGMAKIEGLSRPKAYEAAHTILKEVLEHPYLLAEERILQNTCRLLKRIRAYLEVEPAQRNIIQMLTRDVLLRAWLLQGRTAVDHALSSLDFREAQADLQLILRQWKNHHIVGSREVIRVGTKALEQATFWDNLKGYMERYPDANEIRVDGLPVIYSRKAVQKMIRLQVNPIDLLEEREVRLLDGEVRWMPKALWEVLASENETLCWEGLSGDDFDAGWKRFLNDESFLQTQVSPSILVQKPLKTLFIETSDRRKWEIPETDLEKLMPIYRERSSDFSTWREQGTKESPLRLPISSAILAAAWDFVAEGVVPEPEQMEEVFRFFDAYLNADGKERLEAHFLPILEAHLPSSSSSLKDLEEWCTWSSQFRSSVARQRLDALLSRYISRELNQLQTLLEPEALNALFWSEQPKEHPALTAWYKQLEIINRSGIQCLSLDKLNMPHIPRVLIAPLTSVKNIILYQCTVAQCFIASLAPNVESVRLDKCTIGYLGGLSPSLRSLKCRGSRIQDLCVDGFENLKDLFVDATSATTRLHGLKDSITYFGPKF